MNMELQKMIFEKQVNRRDLLSYKCVEPKTLHVQVFRNHSFELVEHTIGMYLDYSQIGVVFEYSGYDDSLTFNELNKEADLLIIWIDTKRYNSSINEFLNDRIKYLKEIYNKPVLIIPYGEILNINSSSVYVYNLNKLEETMGESFIDERAKDATGTALSHKALMAISRELGLKILPALLKPALKAVIVDFDNTIYKGVLGEDGINGVELTEGHKALQEKLKSLSKEGFFLCAVSKNELSDVLELLQRRDDFPLNESDFSKICASWESKSSSISDIAKFLNINFDAMVFIDDNIGELTAVEMTFPTIKCIHALEDGYSTKEIIDNFPGLLQLNVTKEDSIRKDDVKANEKRRELQNTLSPEEYIKSLQLKLVFDFNNINQINRISELSNKTNQFIFSYMRYSQSDIEYRINAHDYCVISILLSDKLSDSGLIGVCIGKKEKDYIRIEECYISCRALGRGIDDVIILGAIQLIVNYFSMEKIKVDFEKGPRNTPAENFVKENLSEYLEQPKLFNYEFPIDLVKIEINK